jgi:16S rRNA (guanine1516-N2)-methyltransferase
MIKKNDNNQLHQIAISIIDPLKRIAAKELSSKLKLPLVEIDNNDNKEYEYLLVLTDERLELRSVKEKKLSPLYVDFVSGKMGHRRQYGGGRGQLIAHAVGLKRTKTLTILDVTAGLGADAFVLATLGCSVTMIERSPIIAELLLDGLQRAKRIDSLKSLNLELIPGDAKDYLLHLTNTKIAYAKFPDVVYLDPMFPVNKKSALVKKEMRILRDMVGSDLDAPELFQLALQTALKRVVVKRHRLAPTITDLKPDLIFSGKSSRYDVYLVNAQK